MKPDQVPPPADFGQKELPVFLQSPLLWDDLTPNLMQENVRAGVTHVHEQFASSIVGGKVRDNRASLAVWRAIMGKGNANKEQEEDYWEDFDPKADNHENPLELPFPVDDPDFNYLKYNLSLKNIEDRVTAGKITGAEADELTAKLNNEVAYRKDAVQIVNDVMAHHGLSPYVESGASTAASTAAATADVSLEDDGDDPKEDGPFGTPTASIPPPAAGEPKKGRNKSFAGMTPHHLDLDKEKN